jgi:hypothetical protein
MFGVMLSLAACGESNEVRIRAPGASVAVFENGAWRPITIDRGVGTFEPSGPYAIAALCSSRRGPYVDVQLGGPGDTNEMRTRCTIADLPVEGMVEVLDSSGLPGSSVFVWVGDTEQVLGTTITDLPRGVHDIVAYGYDGRWLLYREVEIEEGFHFVFDLRRPTWNTPRPGATHFSFETSRGTWGTTYPAFDVPALPSIAPEALLEGERHVAIKRIDVRDSIRIDVGPQSRDDLGFPPWPAPTIDGMRISGRGGHLEAHWNSATPWTTRTIDVSDFGRPFWHVEAHAGWDAETTTSLVTPDLSGHPGWSALYDLHPQVGTAVELAQRLDDTAEGVSRQDVPFEPTP